MKARWWTTPAKWRRSPASGSAASAASGSPSASSTAASSTCRSWAAPMGSSAAAGGDAVPSTIPRASRASSTMPRNGMPILRVLQHRAPLRVRRADRPCWPAGGVARPCWRLFGLGGYARVDCRVDAEAGPGCSRSMSIPACRPMPASPPPPPARGLDHGGGSAAHHRGVAGPDRRADERQAGAGRRPCRRPCPLRTETEEDARSRPRRPSGRKPVLATSRRGDRAAVRNLTASTGFFSADEVAVAVELVEARLARGWPAATLPVRRRRGRSRRLCLLRPIALTRSSYDLYWIAVRSDGATDGPGPPADRRRGQGARARRHRPLCGDLVAAAI